MDWLVSYWLCHKAKKHSQANRISRAKQKMPHTGGSKSIATLMNEKAIDGIEPTRAEVYILTHTKRKDGRPLDEESSNTVDMMQENLSNNETPYEQPHGSVAWEGDVYSQVLGNEKSGYVRGLGLGPTPSLLWGSKSSLRNVVADGLSNEAAHKLEQETNELKELNKKQDEQINELIKKQNEEIALMKKNQEMLVSELSWMRQVMWKYAPTGLYGRQNNGSTRQVPDANSGNEQGYTGQVVSDNKFFLLARFQITLLKILQLLHMVVI
ncbi:uncharacterized protein LOC132641297 isoform X3 [Lycium barbarum]|uniref:uncharacterized protein LOC132641297 isoform X3 n=1 Tax=Lycium barbarum TaxID=112863 RepID=UPI00293F6547|nr:uncharacterized protein LOC132641297 isoform X3 [Lycium barbarum]XP_060214216.1 uncharacterized protein LOC132641297 isoform X3 [Lycium barbarum]